jgi:PAS domain S-box-containing protein
MASDSAENPATFVMEGEERFRAALDAVTDGVWDWNLRTGEVFYSNRWLESLGCSRADAPPDISFVQSITHPEDRELLADVGRAHLEGRTAYFECEARLRKKSGEYRWTLGRGRVLERSPEGEALRILGANYDVTARKLAELALEQAEGRCRTIVETTGCVIVCLDASYRILEWNPAAEKVYGWKQAEVRGKNYVEWFLPEEVRGRVAEEIQRVFAGGDTVDYENPVLTRDGSERLFLWNSTRLVNSEGKTWGIVGIGQDITEQKQAERQREIARREAQVMAERLQALQGILPICRSCNRVRDQAGSWSRPEEYLGTSIEVSVVRCPDCLENGAGAGPA